MFDFEKEKILEKIPMKKILLVEDEALIAMMEIRELTSRGYRVIHELSGEKAIDAMNSPLYEIDLILMDIDLGQGMDGTKAAQIILQTFNLPVVFLSSHIEPEIVEKTEKITNYGYVVKNSGITVLDASIKMAFKLFDAQQDIMNRKLLIEEVNAELKASIEELQAINNKFEAVNAELRESRNALLINEHRYRLLFENMIAGVALHEMIYDGQGRAIDYRFLEVNPAFEALTGIKVADLMGKTVREVMPETEQYWIDTYDRVVRTGEPLSYQNFSKELDKYYNTWVFTPDTNQFAVVFTDITERKNLEKLARESEEKFRAIVENTSDFIMRYDRAGRHLYGNPAALTATGVAIEQFVGKTHHDLGFPEHLCQLWHENIEKVFLTGKSCIIEFDVELIGGDKYLQLRLCPEFDENGEVNSVIGISRDITDLKLTQQAMKDREQRYALTLEAVNDGLWEWHIQSGQAFLNTRYFNILGYEDNGFPQNFSTWRQFVHPDDIERVDTELARKVENGEGFVIDLRLKTKPGGWLWVTIRGRVVDWDADGKALRMVGTLSDISERKEIEETNLFLAQRGWMKTGESFFNSLARFLAEKLKMDYVCIDRLEEGNFVAQTVAVYFDGKFEDNVSYTLKDTPCGKVIDKSVCCYRNRVRYLFPKDIVLQEMNAEGYAGITLINSEGAPVGLIALISRLPIDNPHLIENVLKLVSVRSAGELERQQSEKALQSLVLHKEFLMKELQHRVKNNLNVISSLLALEMERLHETQSREIFENAINRIQSMAKIYNKLYLSPDLARIDMSVYIAELGHSIFETYHINQKHIRLVTRLDKINLPSKYAVPLGLILNELISNSLKYAFSSDREGIIQVELLTREQTIEFNVTDNGVGFSSDLDPMNSPSMGLRLVNMMAEQIHGKLNMSSVSGISVSIVFSISD